MKFLKENISTLIALILVYLVINMLGRTYIIPSSSMENTLDVGDYIIGKKYEYGIQTPKVPFTEMNVIGDSNYLNKFKVPTRNEILIFLPPESSTKYIKRVYATGGDEVLFYENDLYIHFKEGDEYISKNYSKEKIVQKFNKKWVRNYLKEGNENIVKNKGNNNTFTTMVNDIKSGTKNKVLTSNFNSKEQMFVYKIPENHYFMIGDNRDNSYDSRFFGAIPFDNIKAKAVYRIFNIKTLTENKFKELK